LAIVGETERWWQQWAERCTYDGKWRDAVVRSLVVLKALTFAPTGGVVAAPTTSLPEKIGGVRNWDYRCCWLRDATFTLYALMMGGYTEEAVAWRSWLLRAVAGDPADLQIMYGLGGERRLTERELEWLPGYEASRPVRIGNAAADQLQLDVYGEVLDALHVARRAGVEPDEAAWRLELKLLEFLERAWMEPDEGIWEVRGPRRHFTFSKVMAWVAFDRGIRAAKRLAVSAPVDRWRQLRARIHDDVCRNGFDRRRDTFTQYYGGTGVDASLLLMPAVGFLAAADSRVRGTVACVERELLRDGLVLRYTHDENTPEIDGLPPGEGAFLACTCWLADALILAGRRDEAVRLFERVLSLRNDIGLLAEQYDARQRRQLGNFPQAFSHVALVNTAYNLSRTKGPTEDRQHSGESSSAVAPS
jgi:GH15 family glucan-1,4-alpha-glucosidase